MSANNRRARSAFLWALGLFLSAQLTGGFLIDYVWPAVRFPSCARVLARLAEDHRHPDILCLGSSRFAHGLPEDELAVALGQYTGGQPPEVFNASIPAGDQVTFEFMMQRLLERGVHPRLVVIEVTPESLNHCNSWLSAHVQRQLRWEDLPVYFTEICQAHQLQRLVKARLLPLFLHRKQLWCDGWQRLGGTLPATPPGQDAGIWVKRDSTRQGILDRAERPPTAEQVDATVQGASQVPRWLRDFRVGGTSAAALDRLLQRCVAEGIEMILLAPPVTAAHRAAYTPAIDAEFHAYIRQVAARYHCRFVNCRERVPEGLFLDNHHLLPEGGQYFSELVAREVLVPDGPASEEASEVRSDR
jgi:hypothetical protein